MTTQPRARTRPASGPAVAATGDAGDGRVARSLSERGITRHTVPVAGAAVMGTGIVGIAAHTLPLQGTGLRLLADVSWLLACALLVGVIGLNVAQVVRYPHVARAHLFDRRTAPATGTLAMAFLTVGTATLLIASPWLGLPVARGVDVVLASVGTVLGLVTAVWVPLLLVTRSDHGGLSDAAATWLLPVVPPMVSAAAGGVLAAHLPPGTVRATLVVACLMLFGLSLLAGLLMVSVLWARLLVSGPEPTAAAPSLWVVLGPLGQGATALGAIAVASVGTLPPPYPAGLAVVALVGGTTLLGFAGLWAVLAGVLTLRAVRQKLAFHLGWWSFTFPVGTCVTGLSALAVRTHLPALSAAADIAFVALLAAWLVVATGTVRGLRTGALVSPLAPPPATSGDS